MHSTILLKSPLHRMSQIYENCPLRVKTDLMSTMSTTHTAGLIGAGNKNTITTSSSLTAMAFDSD